MALKPLLSTNSTSQNYNQINDMIRSINNEQQTKVFYGANNEPAVLNGKYADGRYGSIYTVDGVRRILIGQHPVDGRPGIWVSKVGIDVITELS